jgi:hypothetical protein
MVMFAIDYFVKTKGQQKVDNCKYSDISVVTLSFIIAIKRNFLSLDLFVQINSNSFEFQMSSLVELEIKIWLKMTLKM